MSDPASSAGLEPGARLLVERLRQAGFVALWAGGCVRDLLLGRPAKDIDIATDAHPDAVLRLFPHAHPVGRAFGVVLVQAEGHTYEIATFRSERGYSDGRHPDQVSFTNAQEDAQRRDFTINGLFWDPVKGEVLDFVAGQKDLQAGIVRAIGDPAARFAEDHLRLLRAIRFASTLDFALEANTLRAMQQHAHLLGRISAERIQVELIRILTESRQAGRAVEQMHEAGLLAVVLPEVEALQGVEQPPEFHPEGDVFRHTVLMLNLLDHPTPELALAVLLHDIGKPPTRSVVPQPEGRTRIRFDNHAAVGAVMAESVLRRLRCSNALTDHVVHCVRDHMRFIHARQMRTSTLRRLIMSPTFATELELHRVDCLGSHGHLDNYDYIREAADRMRQKHIRPPRLLRGEDVLASGVAAGPRVRAWLEAAYDAQLEGQFTTAEEARAWLHQAQAAHPDGPPASAGPAPSA